MISIFLVVQLRNVFKGFWILAFQRNQDLDVFKGLGIGSFKGCLDLAFQRNQDLDVFKGFWNWCFKGCLGLVVSKDLDQKRALYFKKVFHFHLIHNTKKAQIATWKNSRRCLSFVKTGSSYM